MTLPVTAPPLARIPVVKLLQALREEIPHMVKRQEYRAEKGKVHWGVAAPRIRELKEAQEALDQLIAGMQRQSPLTPRDQQIAEAQRLVEEMRERERLGDKP